MRTITHWVREEDDATLCNPNNGFPLIQMLPSFDSVAPQMQGGVQEVVIELHGLDSDVFVYHQRQMNQLKPGESYTASNPIVTCSSNAGKGTAK